VQPADADGTRWFALSVLLAVALAVASLLNVGLWLLVSQSWSVDRRLREIGFSTQTIGDRLQAIGAKQGLGGDIFNLTMGSLWVTPQNPNPLRSLQRAEGAERVPSMALLRAVRRWPLWSSP